MPKRLPLNFSACVYVTLFGVAIAISVPTFLQAADEHKISTWDGVYTAAQAERGSKTLMDQCSICHGVNMTGGPGVPGLVGPTFLFNWDNKTARELFEFMRTTMPPGQAGSLGDQAYADVLAAILKGNGFPAGTDKELASDPQALDGILIKREKP